MREINASVIIENVARICQEASFFLPEDVQKALEEAVDKEESDIGKETLKIILENSKIASTQKIPLCQDCGFTVVFLELGQEARITGGDLYKAIEEGVRRGYEDGYLRKSIVYDPVIARKNTKDNTPAVVHTDIVPGDKLTIYVLPKGGGSENMSALRMLKPAQGMKGIKDFVIEAVDKAGSNPCPPVIVGVGIGGTSDKVMFLAKKALLRKIGARHPEPEFAELEVELLLAINKLGIGPQGFGGRITALDVKVETFPCHIASMPVGVNIQCHSARWKKVQI